MGRAHRVGTARPSHPDPRRLFARIFQVRAGSRYRWRRGRVSRRRGCFDAAGRALGPRAQAGSLWLGWRRGFARWGQFRGAGRYPAVGKRARAVAHSGRATGRGRRGTGVGPQSHEQFRRGCVVLGSRRGGLARPGRSGRGGARPARGKSPRRGRARDRLRQRRGALRRGAIDRATRLVSTTGSPL